MSRVQTRAIVNTWDRSRVRVRIAADGVVLDEMNGVIETIGMTMVDGKIMMRGVAAAAADDGPQQGGVPTIGRILIKEEVADTVVIPKMPRDFLLSLLELQCWVPMRA